MALANLLTEDARSIVQLREIAQRETPQANAARLQIARVQLLHLDDREACVQTLMEVAPPLEESLLPRYHKLLKAVGPRSAAS